MSARMKRHHTNQNDRFLRMTHSNVVYLFPIKVAEKYRVDDEYVDAEEIFVDIDSKYTKPGALLRGIRVRENITQSDLAKKLKVTQSDISQMETGVRKIGRTIAKRIEKLFGVHYRSFLE